MLNTYAIYIEKLQPEYKSVFKKICDYVNANNMDKMKNEEMLSEVIDTFLTAQNDGKPVDQVIGGNLECFCRQICSDIGIKSRITNFLELIHPVILIYALLSISDLFGFFTKLSDGEKISFLTYRGNENLVAYAVGGLASVIICYTGRFFIRKLVFTNPDKYKKLSFGISAAALVLLVIFLIVIFKGSEVQGTYLWLSLLFSAVFLSAYRIITRQSRQYQKENRISLHELAGVSKNMSSDVEQIEMKRFDKINKKRARKGEHKLTLESFIENEKKDCGKWDKKPGFYIFLTAAGTLFGLIITCFLSGFESFLDMCIYIVLMLGIEGLVMYGLFRLVDIGTKERLAWINSYVKNEDTVSHTEEMKAESESGIQGIE